MANGIKNRIFGSDVPTMIKKKIESRQLLAARDREPNEEIENSAYKDSRKHNYTYGELNPNMNFDGIADLSSRTPFARMWTSLTVSEDEELGELTEDELTAWNEPENLKMYPDHFVVENDDGKSILHKWNPFPNYQKIYQIGNHVLNTLERNPNDPVTMGVENEGGKISSQLMKAAVPHEQELDMNQWMKPAAGITGVSSATEGTLGTLKKTTVNFIVHNFADFENIYLRYFLKPGAQLFVDFGWDTAYLYNPEKLLEETDYEDALYGENGYVTKSEGDLETLFGHVINYDAKIREDGGFDCSVEIVSKNASLMSSGFDERLKERIKHGLDIEILGMAVSGVLGDPYLYEKATQWGQDSTTEDELRAVLQVAASKIFGGNTVKLPGLDGGGDSTEAMSRLSLEHGVFFAGVFEENMKLFINFGWFEDKFLNKEFGFSDSAESLTNSSEDGAKNDERTLKAKFNSRNSFVTYNSELANAMKQSDFRDKASFLYPGTWGGWIGSELGTTYNIKIGMIPDRPEDMSKHMAYGQDYYEYGEAVDRMADRIPLRELFISVDMIKSAIEISSTSSEFFTKIGERIKDACGGIIHLALSSNNYGQNTLSFVDKNMLIDDSVRKASDNDEYLNKLLTFKPYTRNTITKEYDLSFNMPKGGLGNMLAVQSSPSLGAKQSFNEMLDGFVKQELLSRETNGIDDKKVFAKYIPSVGDIASQRLNELAGNSESWNFSKDKILFDEGAKNRNKDNLSKLTFKGVEDVGPGDIDGFERTVRKNLREAARPGYQLGYLVDPPEKGKEAVAEDSKKSEKEIAQANGETLVNSPYDFWLNGAIDTHTTSTTPLIKIEASLKIYGISSLVPGDLIRINYLPKNYFKNSFFQITKIEHSIGTSWDTSLTTVMRLAPRKVKGKDTTFRVGKSYLRNVLKLEDIDEFIHLFANLKPISISSNVRPAGMIDHAFSCEVEVAGDDQEDGFYLPTLWSSEKEKTFKKAIGNGGKWEGTEHKGSGKSIHVKPIYNAELDAGWKAITCGCDIWIERWKKGDRFVILTSGNKWMLAPFPITTKYMSYAANTFAHIDAKTTTRILKGSEAAAGGLERGESRLPAGMGTSLGYNMKPDIERNFALYGFPSYEIAMQCVTFGHGCPSDWRQYGGNAKWYPPIDDYETTRKPGPRG
tara:strand:- start:4 stop:3498 length:3495 start_codon:yes stop_codon:yes gene_type:complete